MTAWTGASIGDFQQEITALNLDHTLYTMTLAMSPVRIDEFASGTPAYTVIIGSGEGVLNEIPIEF
jgi:hypothetical protein